MVIPGYWVSSKLTSWLNSTCLSSLRMRQLCIPSWKPIMIPFLAVLSNLVNRLDFGMLMYARHPKGQRQDLLKLLPNQIWYADFQSFFLVGVTFSRNTAARTAWPHMQWGRFAGLRSAQAFLAVMWLPLLATGFCCGVYGAVILEVIPLSFKSSLNSFELNYPPHQLWCSWWA